MDQKFQRDVDTKGNTDDNYTDSPAADLGDERWTLLAWIRGPC